MVYGRNGISIGIFFSLVIVVGQVGIMLLYGRSWFCTCGSIRVWQGVLDPYQNSQQLTDHYSLLHLAFGVGLFVWLRAIRPHWPLARLLPYAVASSALWEIFENLPFIIQVFVNDGSGLHYSGDSIANSVSDTLCVIVGFLLAFRLSIGSAVAAIIFLETLTYVMIGDGVVAGLLRIAGMPIGIG